MFHSHEKPFFMIQLRSKNIVRIQSELIKWIVSFCKICLLLIPSVRFFFASIVPFFPGLWVPPVGVSGAVVSIATLTTDRVRILIFWSALSVIRIFILKVLTFHICARVFWFAAHANLHKVTGITVLPPFSNFQKATTLKYKIYFAARKRWY